MRRAPELPGLPSELVGQHVLTITSCYIGPIEDAAKYDPTNFFRLNQNIPPD